MTFGSSMHAMIRTAAGRGGLELVDAEGARPARRASPTRATPLGQGRERRRFLKSHRHAASAGYVPNVPRVAPPGRTSGTGNSRVCLRACSHGVSRVSPDPTARYPVLSRYGPDDRVDGGVLRFATDCWRGSSCPSEDRQTSNTQVSRPSQDEMLLIDSDSNTSQNTSSATMMTTLFIAMAW